MEKRVGIFGGSFDPVHNGHIKIARSFLNSGLIRELLILLTPSPPHKQATDQTDFSHRFEMLKLAFQSEEQVRVSDLEKELPQPSYTLQTIKHLQNRYPDAIFYLCLGQDSLRDFHKWHKYKKILERVTLLVASRPDVDTSSVDPEILEKVIFIDHEPVSVSSTEIRNRREEERNELPAAVAEYIERHHLYSS
ncbi:MAG: nicotinate (nicotinamide) nucleotide adenylyltransferase [Bacteroidetes bacterium]|nr:nicotinate (nicotinamide) nucleotide adenylyltransferase [Bacteroidota bacterium]